MVSKNSGMKSQDLLKKNVLETGLCTGCGACISLCPYQVVYRDRTVQLHRCDLDDGKCYAFCPRTEIDFTFLRNNLFESAAITPEIGAVKGYYLTRAADANLRNIAQHGGTVTALMELALNERLIDTAITSERDQDGWQQGIKVKKKAGLCKSAGSRFTVSPIVAAFNQIAAEDNGTLGVVATPCQALALAKMKVKIRKDDNGNIDKLKLVIGLFCGWILSVEKFKVLLQQNNIDLAGLTKMDIPAGRNTMEVSVDESTTSISFNDVRDCIREACRYCFDSTAEFADVSVGSARFGSDWKMMSGWNQLVVRTEAGRHLVDLAVKRGVLEIREAPARSLKELKMAAAEKKRAALKNIICKSGSVNNLLYLSRRDPAIKEYLDKTITEKKSR
jgi:coenzyme F420 hydrogenase subunit beta